MSSATNCSMLIFFHLWGNSLSFYRSCRGRETTIEIPRIYQLHLLDFDQCRIRLFAVHRYNNLRITHPGQAIWK